MDCFLLEIGPLNINYCSSAKRIHPQNSSDGTKQMNCKGMCFLKKKKKKLIKTSGKMQSLSLSLAWLQTHTR